VGTRRGLENRGSGEESDVDQDHSSPPNWMSNYAGRGPVLKTGGRG
jgi:hypothetical protein